MGKNKNKNKKKFNNVTQLSAPRVPDVKQQLTRIRELKKTIQGKPLELRFSPTAWSKLLYMRDIGDTEIGGFGITREDDLLYVDDFITVKQECTTATVDFNDDDVADFTLDMVEDGLQPENFMRIWIHTHPNISPSPSLTDEKTFERVFGNCNWAIMAILSKDDRTYCRIQINDGPIQGHIEIPMKVDFTAYEFPKSDAKAWLEEYKENVTKVTWVYHNQGQYYRDFPGYNGDSGYSSGHGSKYSHGYGIGYSGREYESAFGGTAERIIPNDDAYDYSRDSIKRQYHQDSLAIPPEIEEHIDANTMILLQNLTPHEREYIFDEIRSKHSIGD